MSQQATKPKIKGFLKKLKELQNEQSWFQFYTEFTKAAPERIKTCSQRIKELKKELNFK